MRYAPMRSGLEEPDVCRVVRAASSEGWTGSLCMVPHRCVHIFAQREALATVHARVVSGAVCRRGSGAYHETLMFRVADDLRAAGEAGRELEQGRHERHVGQGGDRAARFACRDSELPRYVAAGGSCMAFSVTVVPPAHFEWHPPHMRAVSAS